MQPRIQITAEKFGGISPQMHWRIMLGVFFVSVCVVAAFAVLILSRVSVREQTTIPVSSSSLKMNTDKLKAQVSYYEQKKKEFEEMEKSLGTR